MYVKTHIQQLLMVLLTLITMFLLAIAYKRKALNHILPQSHFIQLAKPYLPIYAGPAPLESST